MFRKALLPIACASALLALSACGSDDNNSSTTSTNPSTPATTVSAQDALATKTPIKHLVVIFGENVSFDHYFGTYPTAANTTGEPQFTAASGTTTPNNLTKNNLLGVNNPNAVTTTLNQTSGTINGVAVTTPGLTQANSEPFRLDRSQANTESQNHSYTPEQLGDDGGLMDDFPTFTASGSVLPGSTGAFGTKGQVLGYFDGNTVTAYWNYAQHFAMSDNAWTDTFGPSTPGAIEVISGQNNGVIKSGSAATTNAINDGAGGLSLIGDLDPTTDTCTITAGSNPTAMMSGKNIGDLLNTKNITWGGFMGGFNLQTVNPNGTTGCTRSTFSNVLAAAKNDYVQHHAWFQYYATTANPAHTRPTSTAVIGQTDPLDSSATPVHHQYDVEDFFTAVRAGNYPSVSFLKAPAVGDGHPGNSDPLDEQAFVVRVVNFLQQQPDWQNTAVVIAYDDSDGWYDHQKPTITHASFDTTTSISAGGATFAGADQFSGLGSCQGTGTGAVAPQGVNGGAVNGRCGPGTRTPFIVISPFAKSNFIDDTVQITQSSVVRFIEDNWLGGTRLGQGSFDATAGDMSILFDFSSTGGKNAALYVDQTLGTVLSAPPAGSN